MTAAPDTIPARHLLVAEQFTSLQGEGPSLGRPAAFVRLSRCNLRCGQPPGATFVCDTPYTWDTRRFDLTVHSTRRSVDEVASWVLTQPADLVVITGGEPLLQAEPLGALVKVLSGAGRRVEIETNATLAPSPTLLGRAWWNVSPKLAGSGMSEADRIKPTVLGQLAASGRAVFKFVVSHERELDEVEALSARFALHPVLIMPEGTDTRTLLDQARTLAPAVMARGWRLTLRLHILLFGNTPGT